jgi:hypothetical protein
MNQLKYDLDHLLPEYERYFFLLKRKIPDYKRFSLENILK